MVLVQKEIKAVYLWDTKVRPPTPPYVIDYVADTSWISSGTYNYYYWVTFTPKVNCTLDKILFLWSTSWTLKIAQWAYASSTTSQVTYSISGVTEYELATPYQLTANTKYCVSVYWTIWWKQLTFPVDWENVTFNYGTYSYNSNQLNYVEAIKWLQTTAT